MMHAMNGNIFSSASGLSTGGAYTLSSIGTNINSKLTYHFSNNGGTPNEWTFSMPDGVLRVFQRQEPTWSGEIELGVRSGSLTITPSRVSGGDNFMAMFVLSPSSGSNVPNPLPVTFAQPISTNSNITNSNLPVTISGQPISTNANVTNSSLPVTVSGGMEILNQPVWTTQYGPQTPAVAMTRRRNRHPKDNAIAVLNQFSSLDQVCKKLPLYSDPINKASDDTPSFDCTCTYRGGVYLGSNGKSKFEARTKAASQALLQLRNTVCTPEQTATLNSWKRDLTTEGVEPNPGPEPTHWGGCVDVDVMPDLSGGPRIDHPSDYWSDEYKREVGMLPPLEKQEVDVEEYKAHLQHMTRMNNEKGDYFDTISSVFGLPTSNRFAALREVVCESEPSDNILEIPRKPHRPAPTHEQERKEKPKPTKPAPVVKSDEEKKIERAAVKERIVNKLKSNPGHVIFWITKPMSEKFRDEILTLLWGENWTDLLSMNQYQWLTFAYINKLTKFETAVELLSYDHKYEILSCDDKLLLLNQLCDSSELALKKSHNKVMHATNGNIFTNDFEEVKKTPTFQHMIEKNEALLPLSTGNEMESMLGVVDGDENPNFSNIFFIDRLRANGTTVNNNVTHNMVSVVPSTNMIPRTVRSAAGLLINALQRLRISRVNTSTYMVNKTERSDLAVSMSNNVTLQNFSTWRKNNISLAGFSSRDIVNMSNVINVKGISMEQVCFKLELLHSILSTISTGTSIPGSVYSIVDNNTAPTALTATLGVNNSPVFGESCGGFVAPVFPFSGTTGNVAFHSSLDTVPLSANRRQNAIFCPPGLLDAGSDTEMSLALFVMMWAEYPFAMYTTSKQTTTAAGAQLGNQLYIANQNLVQVPGFSLLDIVLPRKVSDSDPTTQQQAQSQSTVIPAYGPQAVGAIVPSGQININYLGGPVQQVNLCEYLVSWAQRFDITSLVQFISRLNTIISVSNTMCVVHDLNVALCQQIPSMKLANGGSSSPAVNTTCQFSMNYTSGMLVSQSTQDFGTQQRIAADIRVYETDAQMWNMAVLGLLKGADLKVDIYNNLPQHLGSPKSMHWERLEAIRIAAVWQTMYHMTGMTTEAWNAGYTNVESKFIQKRVRCLFTNETSHGFLKSSKTGPVLTSLFKNMFGRAPAAAMTLYGEDTMTLTHFGRWLPFNSFSGTFQDDVNIVNFFPPTLISDCWMFYFASKINQAFMQFPPVNASDGLKGFNNKDDSNLSLQRITNQLVATYSHVPNNNDNYYPLSVGPKANDKDIWNNRLTLTGPQRSFVDRQGAAAPDGPVATGLLPVGRAIYLNVGENLPLEQMDSSTTCVPAMSSTARRIYVVTTTPIAVEVTKACNKALNLNRSVFKLGALIEPELQAMADGEDYFMDSVERHSSFLEKATIPIAPEVDLAASSAGAPNADLLAGSSSASTGLTQPAPIQGSDLAIV
nr:MAG: capsid protein [Crogonang virus 20]